MANVFAILTAVVLAAAAFVASKNKTKYEEEISARQDAERLLAKTQRELKDFSDQYDETLAERTAIQEEIAALRETEAAQQKKNKELDDDLAAKSEKSESNAKKIAEVEAGLREIGPVEELADKMKLLSEELEQLRLDIAGNEARIVDLTSEKRRTDSIIADYRTKDGYFANKRSFFDSTRIGSVFPAYGFVTLPIGNASGVVSGSALNVVRDGEVVAKLRVSSVESGRAAAEIVPDSLAEGTVLTIGDRVVPSSETN